MNQEHRSRPRGHSAIPAAAIWLAALSAFAASPATSAEANEKPNVICIMADDLGYGDLGCYGQKRIKTPAIDKMAAEGIRFTDHYAGSTVCAPSRCVLMTGLHTGHCQVRNNQEVQPMGQMPLRPGTTTVARLLQQAGYATALIGKWGLGGPGSTGVPNQQGFDYFFGYLCQRHAHNQYPEFLVRNAERVPLPGNKVAKPREDGAGMAVERGQYAPDLCTDEAIKFVERNKDRPFFLYYSPTLPHANNEAGNIAGIECAVAPLRPYGTGNESREINMRIRQTRAGVRKMVFVSAALLLSVCDTVAWATWYGEGVERGADIAMMDLRWPWWPSGTYYANWNMGVVPQGSISFYAGFLGGVPDGPGGTPNPDEKLQDAYRPGSVWSFWGGDKDGNPVRFVDVAPNLCFKNAYGAEGCNASLHSEPWDFMRHNRWYTMLARLWQPADL